MKQKEGSQCCEKCCSVVEVRYIMGTVENTGAVSHTGSIENVVRDWTGACYV